MPAAPIPGDEARRLEALQRLGLLDTPKQERFDRITRTARTVFGTQMAAISLVDVDRQWFLSGQGLEVRETPRKEAFCAHAILGDQPLIILDARDDPRVRDSSLVVHEPGIRFYAGIPLRAGNGTHFGTLCVFDRAPRAAFSEQQIETLQDLAAWAEEECNLLQVQQERLEIARKEQATRSELELERLRGIFVDSISHELRTPLTAIIGFMELLEDAIRDKLSSEHSTWLDLVIANCRRLSRLVDDLLDYARMESGTFRLQCAATDLALEAREVAQSLAPRIAEAGLRLLVEPVAEPVVVWMDAQRIGQVISNLLANAIKYTGAGGKVTVRVFSYGDRAVCEVEDTGPGIDPGDVPKLFKRFSQLSGTARTAGGAGLGLAISKAIVSAHGGAIGVRSQLGEGSIFWFALPLDSGH